MIETERLVLRPYRPMLAARIADGAPRDPRWADDFPGDGEQLAARMFLQAGAPAGPWVPYTVELRATGLVVGGAGFHGAPDRHGTVELGYGLVAAARGHGYATEATNALVALAAKLGARLVVAELAHDNPPSANVLRRAGFTQVEPLRWTRSLV
ncbi:GNAT family N-acetyltransferase [Catellatospora sp. NPDC049609]|uniref:GNAT family N-acetyltransferase n=1 Tax=Catellatospora sp. NPDC049609 TaxID=3155505 RepID=UPI003418FA5E